MIYLNEFLDIIPPRIVGGDKYSYTCYGDRARFLDFEQNVDLVFDEKSQEIYEISIRDGSDEDSSDVWRNPEHETAYLDELRYNRRYTDEDIDNKKSNVATAKDMIERIQKLYESGSIF